MPYAVYCIEFDYGCITMICSYMMAGFDTVTLGGF